MTRRTSRRKSSRHLRRTSRRKSSRPLRRNAELSQDEFNKALAKLLPKLKRDLGVGTIRQGYKGTGKQAHRRQVFVRLADGTPTDIWLDTGFVTLGGIHKRLGQFKTHDKTPTEAYAEILRMLTMIAL